MAVSFQTCQEPASGDLAEPSQIGNLGRGDTSPGHGSSPVPALHGLRGRVAKLAGERVGLEPYQIDERRRFGTGGSPARAKSPWQNFQYPYAHPPIGGSPRRLPPPMIAGEWESQTRRPPNRSGSGVQSRVASPRCRPIWASAQPRSRRRWYRGRRRAARLVRRARRSPRSPERAARWRACPAPSCRFPIPSRSARPSEAMASDRFRYRGTAGWVMIFSGFTPPTKPPGEVTVSVSPICSTTVGRGTSQSR